MTKQVIITTDSSADMPPQLRGEIGLRAMPLHIATNGRNGRDCVDIFPADLFEAHRLHKAIPKTAAPSPEEYREFFEGFTGQGADVVHVSLNGKVSSCWQNAVRGAQEAEGEVHVVDCRMFCFSQGMLCIQAGRLRGEGLAAAEIAEELTRLRSKVWGWYDLDGLEFIAKSGRLPSVVAFGASLFSIHPAVFADGSTGEFIIGKKYRGKSGPAAEAWMRDQARRFLEECDPAFCMIGHTSDVPAEISGPVFDIAREILQPHVGRLVFDGEGKGCAGCVTVSHVGGGSFAIAGMAK